VLVVDNPNLSVVLPVGCNAKCAFCYWKEGCGLTPERLKFVCDRLPDEFQQCSITGGEPTMSRELGEYLSIARERFPKVVLNTNGFNLSLDHMRTVTHVNISRHHWDDVENMKVFDSNSVPLTSELAVMCDVGNVTLNCFLPPKFEHQAFIDNYIQFAKDLGARVAFRKYYSDLEVLDKVDKQDTLVGSHSCGACLHRWHTINGVDVTFKYSVQETSDAMGGGVYELILQANGDLTFDWAGKKKLEFKEE